MTIEDAVSLVCRHVAKNWHRGMSDADIASAVIRVPLPSSIRRGALDYIADQWTVFVFSVEFVAHGG